MTEIEGEREEHTPLRNGAKCSHCVSFGNRVGWRGGGGEIQHPFERGWCAAAGRKREINIARRSGGAWERHAAGNGGRGPHRGLELELDGSPARKIHIFKYFSHGPQSPRHAALPPTACATHYVPTTYQVRAWASPRVRRAVFWLPRSPLPFSLCPSPSFPLSFVTIRRTMARNTRVLYPSAGAACVSLYRTGSTSTGELLLVETLRLRREM